MTTEFEERITLLLERLADRVPSEIPPPRRTTSFAAADPDRSRHRRGWIGVGLAGVAAALLATVVAVTLRDDRVTTVETPAGSVDPTEPTGSTSTPTATSAAPSSTLASTTSAVPGFTPGPDPDASVTVGATVPLETIIDTGGPVGLIDPSGYRIVYGNDQGGGVGIGGSPGRRWGALYQEWIDGRFTGRSFEVMIDDLLPGVGPYDNSPVGPDLLNFGELTGRAAIASDQWQFRSPVGGDAVLAVWAQLPPDLLAPVIEGIRVRDDGSGADVDPPANFREIRIEGGWPALEQSRTWAVAYQSVDDPSVSFTITTISGASAPVAQYLSMPGAVQIEIGGRLAVSSPSIGQVFVELSPTVQLQLGLGSILDPIASLGLAGEVDSLIAVADQLGVFAEGDWKRITAAVSMPTVDLPPIDPCQTGIVQVDVEDPLGDPPFSPDWTVYPGDEVRLRLTPRAGADLGDVRISLVGATSSVPPGATTVLAELGELFAATEVVVAWDGTIDGAPAPPGRYSLNIEATVLRDALACPGVTESFPVTPFGAYAVVG